MTRSLVTLAVLVSAAVATGAALAVGPWPGTAPAVWSSSGDVRYTAANAAGRTTVRAFRNGEIIASAKIAGAFGIPAVTSNGEAGGLSPDGRILVLVEPATYNGLRQHSRFVVLSTSGLSRVGSIVLPGEFGFDAISPDNRTLYVIQHVSARDLVRYVVRAYDLRAKRLLPGAIVDKRDPGEAMRGYPVARASSTNGGWVYTLYTRNANSSVFVHALNAAGRYAFCIDLPGWTGGNVWDATLALSNGTLVVRSGDGTTVARIDTKTLRVA
jgi:hypothetical protein